MSIQEIIKSEFLEGKKNKYQKILNKASSEAKEKANLLGSNIVKKTSLFSASLSNKISKGIEKANSYADKFKGRVDELISLKEDAGISYFLLCYSEKKDLFKISHELYISSYDPIEELTNFVKIFELNCSSSEWENKKLEKINRIKTLFDDEQPSLLFDEFPPLSSPFSQGVAYVLDYIDCKELISELTNFFLWEDFDTEDYRIEKKYNNSEYDLLESKKSWQFLKPFDILKVDRSFGAYQHVGVYLGGGEVIHIRRDKDPGFVKGSFEDFLKGGKDKSKFNLKINRPFVPFKRKGLIESHIRKILLNNRWKGNYSAPNSNCEHFANFLVYGFNFSRQSSLVFFGSNLNPGHLVFNIGSRFQEFVNSIPLGGEAIVKKIISWRVSTEKKILWIKRELKINDDNENEFIDLIRVILNVATNSLRYANLKEKVRHSKEFFENPEVSIRKIVKYSAAWPKILTSQSEEEMRSFQVQSTDNW